MYNVLNISLLFWGLRRFLTLSVSLLVQITGNEILCFHPFLLVCLFVSKITQKTTSRISTKLNGRMQNSSGKNSLNFGVDLNQKVVPGGFYFSLSLILRDFWCLLPLALVSQKNTAYLLNQYLWVCTDWFNLSWLLDHGGGTHSNWCSICVFTCISMYELSQTLGVACSMCVLVRVQRRGHSG